MGQQIEGSSNVLHQSTQGTEGELRATCHCALNCTFWSVVGKERIRTNDNEALQTQQEIGDANELCQKPDPKQQVKHFICEDGSCHVVTLLCGTDSQGTGGRA